MSSPPFEISVFVNCPFDKEYDPILQSILFCIVYLGFHPRISRERSNSAENRVDKIRDLISDCKYSIHDISRSQAAKKGEYFRLNMPFELGMDYGCRHYFGDGRDLKCLLILDEKQYRYQAALSDLSGCDIEYHGADFQKAVRKVRNWLVTEAKLTADGASRILGHYTDFQGWHFEKQLAAGFSEDDIKDYPTNELLKAMQDWLALGKPLVAD